jgi:diaminopimelate decarboxylase
VLIEPGRAIAGPAGVLLTRVLYVKQERGKTFVIADAGMNDLLRPALYQAAHGIENVDRVPNNRTVVGDVVGPVCETADAFLRDAAIGRADEGDLLAIRDAGAYGFAMASNYNFRMRPAEVLVENGAAKLVRRRENYEDLIRPEIV